VLRILYNILGLRRTWGSLNKMKRPLCVIAMVFLFVLSFLFLGRSYREFGDDFGKQEVFLEGTVVNKQYKSTTYGEYWQITLKNVILRSENEIKIAKKGVEEVKTWKNDVKIAGTEDNRSNKIHTLEGKYLCDLQAKETYVCKIGQRVLISGQFSSWEEVSNQGQFDFGRWNCSQGILGQFKKCSIRNYGNYYSKFREGMWQFRTWLHKKLLEELGEKDGSLIAAMLLGEKSSTEEEIKNLYQRNGISHVLAISGLHLSLLGMGLYFFLKQIFGNSKGVAVCCMIFMIIYCIFTGSSVSTIRATIMFGISFLAKLLGRSYDSLSALALAAILQLLHNPYALNNSGFLLSFLAVIGVTFVAPKLQEILQAENKFMKSFCVSLSASITTLPVLLCNYGSYPWYSVFLNLCIVPVMSVLLLFSVVLIIMLLFPYVLPVFLEIKTCVIVCSAIKTVVIYTVKIILAYMEICCRMFEKLPFQDGFLGSPSKWQIAVYALFLLTAIIGKKLPSLFCRKMILLSAITILTMRTGFGMQVTMLDVGQGDGIVIRNDNGRIYLYDCGSSDVSMVGKYRLLPFLRYKGYGKIQGIFISHMDKDHTNGILELLQRAKEENMKISYLFLPESVKYIMEDIKKVTEMEELANQNGTQVKYLEQGDVVTDGKLKFCCLYPGETEGVNLNKDERNNKSQVLFVEYKDFSMLLTGDVEKEGENEILQYVKQNGGKLKCDVLKVAHHGSSGSSSVDFLEYINPDLSLISCGEGNSYGHPHKETLERLENAGSRILSTKESGQLTLKIRKKKVEVVEYKETK